METRYHEMPHTSIGPVNRGARNTRVKRQNSFLHAIIRGAGVRGAGIRGTVSRGALSAFAINVTGAGIAFGLHVLLSRTMGLESYGVYVYAFTWISVLALVSKLGLDTGLVRFLPAFAVHESWPQMNGILRQSTRLTLATSLILAGSTGLAVWLFGAELAPELRYTLWLGCLVLPVLALTQLRQAALRGFKRIPRAEMPDRILRPLVMGAIVVILGTVFERHIGATVVMTAHLAALAGAFLIAHYWMARAVPQPARRATPAYETGKWLKTSLPLVFVSAAHLILSQIDVLMVGSLLGSAETGIYAVAARISAFVIFGLIAINAIAAPMISQLHAAGRMIALQRMLTLTARANLVFALAVALVIIAAGEWILLLFGSSFARGHGALVILTGGHVVNALAGSVGFLMIMTGHERDAARIMAWSVAANIALNAMLIPLWGLEGAATATAATTVLWNLLMLSYTRRKLNVDASAIPVPW